MTLTPKYNSKLKTQNSKVQGKIQKFFKFLLFTCTFDFLLLPFDL